MRDKDDDNEKQILILVSLKGTMILSKKKGKKRRHFPDTVHSLVLQRFRLYLTTFRGKGVVPRTVAWYAKICDKGGWSICVHTAVVTCTCCWCASMYADMEKPVATLSEWRPQGSSRKKRRERERGSKQGPNIGCQEFSYLDATFGKSRAFPRKNSST